jgi:hypothetical protein
VQHSVRDDRALSGAVAVINCAGPFAATAAPMIEGALRAGIGYVDVAAEIEANIDTFRDFADRARAAGTVVLPPMAFFGGLGDLLATTAMGDWEAADEVHVAVLIATLHSDLGGHRKIGPVRLLRPVVIAGAIVPLFIDPVVTHGAGLAVELAGVAAGILGGLAVLALMRVYRSPRTGKPVTRAGWAYALLWTLVIGARAAFSYGATHWFSAQLDQWCLTHHVTGAAITDGLIFMAVVMILTRTLGLGARAAALRPAATDGLSSAAGAPTL